MTQINPQAAWLVLARYADAVEQSGAPIETAMNPGPPGERRSPEVVIRFRLTEEAVASLQRDQDREALAQMAERLSVKWGEAAESLRDVASGKTPPPIEIAKLCKTCNAAPGAWCSPVHEGERVSGGWIHPGRKLVERKLGTAVDNARDLVRFNPSGLGGVPFGWPGVMEIARALVHLAERPARDADATRFEGRTFDTVAEHVAADATMLAIGAISREEVRASRWGGEPNRVVVNETPYAGRAVAGSPMPRFSPTRSNPPRPTRPTCEKCKRPLVDGACVTVTCDG